MRGGTLAHCRQDYLRLHAPPSVGTACLPVGRGPVSRVGRHKRIFNHAELNILEGSNKFAVIIKGNSLFSLHKTLNIGWTRIIGYQGESDVIEIFVELGKVINSHSYIKIGVK
jgi:hypothetical protein